MQMADCCIALQPSHLFLLWFQLNSCINILAYASNYMMPYSIKDKLSFSARQNGFTQKAVIPSFVL